MTHEPTSRRIVVGVDGSAASAAAVRWAVREARLRHAVVHLVCAYHSDARLLAPYATSSWLARQDEHYAAAKETLDVAEEFAHQNLPPGWLTSELVNEPPARALLDRATDAEMLVLGTTRPTPQRDQPPGAMGPVARACLRQAHCPVVIVAPDVQPWHAPEHVTPRQRVPQAADQASALAPAATLSPNVTFVTRV
jgi:nucleotide-binding universal stress UspA family protein